MNQRNTSVVSALARAFGFSHSIGVMTGLIAGAVSEAAGAGLVGYECVVRIALTGILGGCAGLLLMPIAAILSWRQAVRRAYAFLLPTCIIVASALSLFANGLIVTAITSAWFIIVCLAFHGRLPRIVEPVDDNVCVQCGYDVRGLKQCPECGAGVTHEPHVPTSPERKLGSIHEP